MATHSFEQKLDHLRTNDDAKRKCLRLLAARKGEAVELVTDYQVAIWNEMDRMGYARVSDSARCGFEMVRGHFVSITEAGLKFVDVAPSA